MGFNSGFKGLMTVIGIELKFLEHETLSVQFFKYAGGSGIQMYRIREN